jgi:hypothetical protein
MEKEIVNNKLKLYHIYGWINNYDQYSDFIVCAETKDEAKSFIFNKEYIDSLSKNFIKEKNCDLIWFTKLGIEKWIICESFHAG